MRRHTTQRQFRALVDAARAAIPQLRVTSDVIVGFPGETDAEFAESERFIRELDLGGLHVFRYSSRPGTPAARMKGHVYNAVKKRRSAILLDMSAQMESDFAESLRGIRQDVLWEQVIGASPDGFLHSGYTDNYMRVKAAHPRDLSNVIASVEMGIYIDGAIHGTVKEIPYSPTTAQTAATA